MQRESQRLLLKTVITIWVQSSPIWAWYGMLLIVTKSSEADSAVYNVHI